VHHPPARRRTDRLDVFQGGTSCGKPRMLTVMVDEDERAVLDGNLLVGSDGVHTFGSLAGTRAVWKLVKDEETAGGWAISRPAVSGVLRD